MARYGPNQEKPGDRSQWHTNFITHYYARCTPFNYWRQLFILSSCLATSDICGVSCISISIFSFVEILDFFFPMSTTALRLKDIPRLLTRPGFSSSSSSSFSLRSLSRQTRHQFHSYPAKMSGLTPVFTKDACPRKFYTRNKGRFNDFGTSSDVFYFPCEQLPALTARPSRPPVRSGSPVRSPPTPTVPWSPAPLQRRPSSVARTSRPSLKLREVRSARSSVSG